MTFARRIAFSLLSLSAVLFSAPALTQVRPVYTSSTPVSIGTAVPRHMVLADFNGDGFNDLATVGYANDNTSSTPLLEIHLADFKGSFNRSDDAFVAIDQCSELEGMATFGTDSSGNTNLAILCYDTVQIWHIINTKNSTTPVAISDTIVNREVVAIPNGAASMVVGDFTGLGANGIAIIEISGSDRSLRYLPPVICANNCLTAYPFTPITNTGAVVLDVSTILGANQIATALASYALPAAVFPYPLLVVATTATTGNCGGYVQPLIYRASSGKFVAAGTNLTIKAPFCPTAVATGDLNNDNVPDLVVAGTNANNTGINGFVTAFTGLGNGGFATTGVLFDIFGPAINSNELLAIADINGDGNADVIAAGPLARGYTAPQDSITYYLGDGNLNVAASGTFGANNIMSGSSQVGGGINALLVNNTDADGALDVAAFNIVGTASGGSIGNFTNLFNTATQSFSGRTGINTSLRMTAASQTTGATLTVTIQGGTSFTGFVQIYDTTIGAFAGSTKVSGNSAAFNVYGSGTHGYVASYYGNDTYTGSISGTPVFVKLSGGPAAASTTTMLSASATSVTQGTSVSLTATTTSTSTPDGGVTFFDGATSLGTVTLDSTGKATLSTSSLSPGAHSITATYVGNTNFATSTSTAVTVTVAAPVASATALAVSNANPMTGTAITFTATSTGTGGTPTGTITFYDGTSLLGSSTLDGTGKATFSTGSLSVATHTVTASYSGDTKFMTSVSPAVSVTVKALGVSSTALTASAASITAGQSEALTAKVSSSATGIPTGSITFRDGTTTLGTVTVDTTATAAFTTTGLAAGTHTLTATYAGDTAFASSTSMAVTVTVTAAVTPAFSVGVSPTTVSIKQGQSAMVTFTATPTGGFAGTVLLGCSGLPTGATCVFAPTSIVLDGTNKVITSLLTLSTTAPHTQQSTQASFSSGLFRSLLALGLGAFVLAKRRKLRMASLLLFAVMLSTLLGVSGCADNSTLSNSNATPAGSYSLTVSATVSGAAAQTAPLSVTVTQ